MKKNGLLICLFSIGLLVHYSVNAQNKKVTAVITADSLASGNYKDVLTSFFQIAFDKLTGKEKELKFRSNPYAVMMKANPDLEIDYNYKKNRVLRNLNFDFSIRLDTSYHFNGFSSAVSYAIINKRDHTVFAEFIQLAMDKNREFNALNDGLVHATAATPDAGLKARLREQRQLLLNDEKYSFDKLDKDVREIVMKVIRDSSLTRIETLVKKNNKATLAKTIRDGYNEVKRSFQSRPLLTVSISDTTYKDEFLFSNLAMKTEFLKGFGNSKPGANWEFNIPATLNFLDDPLQNGRDLKRALFRFEPGINLVIRNSSAEHSFFEMKFSGEYQHILKGLKTGEEKEHFTFNGTLRVRIIHDIWIPLQFKYDPDKGNVLGFLSVKFNFSGQGGNK